MTHKICAGANNAFCPTNIGAHIGYVVSVKLKAFYILQKNDDLLHFWPCQYQFL